MVVQWNPLPSLISQWRHTSFCRKLCSPISFQPVHFESLCNCSNGVNAANIKIILWRNFHHCSFEHFICISRNRSGPNTVPWGTPDVTAKYADFIPSQSTSCCLHNKVSIQDSTNPNKTKQMSAKYNVWPRISPPRRYFHSNKPRNA